MKMLATLMSLGLWITGTVWLTWVAAWHKIMAAPPPLLPQTIVPSLLLVASGVALVRLGQFSKAVLAVLLAGPTFLLPNFIMARGQGKLRACCSNLKNIGTALEMYASDNSGVYPPTLAGLTVGNYLRVIPSCPGEDEEDPSVDTYTPGYLRPTENTYRLCCKGKHHPILVGRPDSPKYDSENRLSY